MNKAFYFLIALTFMFIAPMDIHSQLKMDSVAVTDISCYGDDDGKIIVYVSGGTEPYRYGLRESFFSENNFITSNFSNNQSYSFEEIIPNKEYWVFVEDNDGLTAVQKIIADISEPEKLTAEISHETNPADPDYFDVTINVSGGNYPYQLYDENNNKINDSFEDTIKIESIKKGNYNWYIHDTNNCKLEFDFDLN